MRERITIKYDDYQTSSTGMASASATTTVGTYWADVEQVNTDQDLTGSQNILEETWSFRMRNQDDDFTKKHYITWRSNDYSIIRITSQAPSKRWITITANKVA